MITRKMLNELTLSGILDQTPDNSKLWPVLEDLIDASEIIKRLDDAELGNEDLYRIAELLQRERHSRGLNNKVHYVANEIYKSRGEFGSLNGSIEYIIGYIQDKF